MLIFFGTCVSAGVIDSNGGYNYPIALHDFQLGQNVAPQPEIKVTTPAPIYIAPPQTIRVIESPVQTISPEVQPIYNDEQPTEIIRIIKEHTIQATHPPIASHDYAPIKVYRIIEEQPQHYNAWYQK